MAIIEDKPNEVVQNQMVEQQNPPVFVHHPHNEAETRAAIMRLINATNEQNQMYNGPKITPDTPMPPPSCYQTPNQQALNTYNTAFTYGLNGNTGPVMNSNVFQQGMAQMQQYQQMAQPPFNPQAVHIFHNRSDYTQGWREAGQQFDQGMMQLQQQQQQYFDYNNPRPECLVVSPYNQTPNMQQQYNAVQNYNQNLYRNVMGNNVRVVRPDDNVIRTTNISPIKAKEMDMANRKHILEERNVGYTEQFNLRKFNRSVENKSYKPTVIREDDIVMHIDCARERVDNMYSNTHHTRIYDKNQYQNSNEITLQRLTEVGALQPAIRTYVYQSEGGSDGYYWMDANGVVMPCVKNHCFTNNMKAELAEMYGLKEEEIEGVFIVKEYNISTLAKSNTTLTDYIKGRVSQYYNCLNELRQRQNTRVITESLMNEFAKKIWSVYEASETQLRLANGPSFVGNLDSHVRFIRYIPYDKITSNRSVYVASAGLVIGDDSILNGTEHPEWKYILPEEEEELEDEVFDFKIKIVDNTTNRQNFITIGSEYFPIRSKRSSYEQEGVYVTVSNRDKTLNKSYTLPLDKAHELGITHTEEEASFLRFTSNKTKLLNIEAELQMTKNKLAKVELEKQMLETKKEVLTTDREVERFKSENKVQNVVMEQATKELDFARNETRENLKFARDITKGLMDGYLDKLKHALNVYEVNCKMIERERAAELALRELDYKSAKLNSETGLSVMTIIGKFAKIVGS